MRMLLSALVMTAFAALAACQSPSTENSAAAPVARAQASTPVTPTPASAEQAEQAIKLRAGGTEPFWGVDVDGDSLLYTTPENMRGVRLSAKPTLSARGIHYAGTHEGKPFSLDIREAGVCSDGMSEIEYRYTVDFRFDGRDLKGCANDVP